MYLNDLFEYLTPATNVVPVIKHPYLGCFIEVLYKKAGTSAFLVEKIYVEGSSLYVELDFDRYVREFFDKDLNCCLMWHKVYTAKTIQELLLLDENCAFVSVLEDLSF